MWLGELDEPETRWLLDAESGLIHQLSGQLLFISQHTLYTQGFDIARLAAIGNRSMVADNVAAASVSDTGIVAYRSASVMERRQFVWFDRSGNEIGKVGTPDEAYYPAGGAPSLSPNARYVAVTRTVDGNRDIWLGEMPRGDLGRGERCPRMGALRCAGDATARNCSI